MHLGSTKLGYLSSLLGIGDYLLAAAVLSAGTVELFASPTITLAIVVRE